ncbi:16567_t:CDS:1 [Dentiscutata erythropus]|uniref:16567_t:CDS:1 n=1 Tax=Dentiscutata erythropus TaxID=1348616 RepID=A0A9N9KDU0_9GLOM|nr:16567_t:CDS:1 [Dentiscutata erythropus]
MGDFNAIPNPKLDCSPAKRTQTPESQLIKFLSPYMHNTFHLFHPNSIKFTFSHNNSHSRIDQIWTNMHTASLDYADIIEDATIESDHNIILLEFSILLTLSSLYKQPSRKVTLWKQASPKQIQKYQTHIDQNLIKIRSHILQIQNQVELDKA